MKYSYRALFTESLTYEVEFESDELLNGEDETTWFRALDTYNPDWISDAGSAVNDRTLIELTREDSEDNDPSVSDPVTVFPVAR
jgi:hypothetical protein